MVDAVLAEVLVRLPRAIFIGLRCRQALRRWLSRQSLELLSSEERGFFRGPFSWEFQEGDIVKRIEVLDAAGQVRKGFLRCCSHDSGFLGQHVIDVRWD